MARILTRVGACADELRSMGVERAEVFANVGSADGGWGSVARFSFLRQGSALDGADVSGSLRGRRKMIHAVCGNGKPYRLSALLSS